MGCRWWVKGIKKFRILKKNCVKPYQDGVLFSWDEWDREITEVRSLSVGDPIWNPYRSCWDKVKKVELYWAPISSYRINFDTLEVKHGRTLGSYISEYAIKTEKGSCIYDSPSQMKKWCENYGVVQDKDR